MGKVHFEVIKIIIYPTFRNPKHYSETACGLTLLSASQVISEVTCLACRRTKAFRKAMEGRNETE